MKEKVSDAKEGKRTLKLCRSLQPHALSWMLQILPCAKCYPITPSNWEFFEKRKVENLFLFEETSLHRIARRNTQKTSLVACTIS